MNINSKIGSFYENNRETHYGILLVTALVSLAIHFLLYTRVADMRFDVTADLPEKYRETPQRKIARFEHLKVDPAEALPVPKFDNPSQNHDIGLSSKQLSEIVSVPAPVYAAPPVSEAVLEAATVKEVEISRIAPDDSVWQPRQEIIKITDKVLGDDSILLPRREILPIERFSSAPDYVPPVEIKENLVMPVMDSMPRPGMAPSATAIEEAPKPPAEKAKTATAKDLKPARQLPEFGEKPQSITPYRAVEERLDAKMTLYAPNDSRNAAYFKIEITPKSPSVLPAVPKDILFLQDSSRSLSWQRLPFCKKALIECLGKIGPQDRFNVASFKDSVSFCFENSAAEGTSPIWAYPTADNLSRAEEFINSLKSEGDTDIFTSLRSLTSLPADRKRPLIVMAVTDGNATTGITDSSRIIAEFSRINDNISLYLVGTHPKANNYFLDLVSFCNRGSKRTAPNDRFKIPGHILSIADESARPVLGRITATTDSASNAEIFPLPSANLYADRPLVYYGSCPASAGRIALHIRGEGGEAKCDSIFEFDLSKAERGSPEIALEWAKRKIYTLIGLHAREPSDSLLVQIDALSRRFRIEIPYWGSF